MGGDGGCGKGGVVATWPSLMAIHGRKAILEATAKATRMGSLCASLQLKRPPKWKNTYMYIYDWKEKRIYGKGQ